MVKNLPSNAGDVGSIPSGGTKDPTCQGANKPVHISTMEPHTRTVESALRQNDVIENPALHN